VSSEHSPGRRGLWPEHGAPGRYRATCSCRASLTGSATEIYAWAMAHDDSPGRSHIVSIANGGRRVDGESESGTDELTAV
jgi:hypothetical protein